MASLMTDELAHLDGEEWIVAWLQRRKDIVAKHNTTDDKMAMFKAQAEVNYQNARQEYISLDDATWCLIYESLGMINPEHTSKMAPQPKKKNAAIDLACSLLEEKVLIIGGLEDKLKEARAEIEIAAKKEKLLQERLRIMEEQHDFYKENSKGSVVAGEQICGDEAKVKALEEELRVLKDEKEHHGKQLAALQKLVDDKENSRKAQSKNIAALQNKLNQMTKELEALRSTVQVTAPTIAEAELMRQLQAENEAREYVEIELSRYQRELVNARKSQAAADKHHAEVMDKINARATVAEGLVFRTLKKVQEPEFQIEVKGDEPEC